MKCIICGIEFLHLRLKKNTCSKKCRDKAYYRAHKTDINKQRVAFRRKFKYGNPEWVKKQQEYNKKSYEKRRRKK